MRKEKKKTLCRLRTAALIAAVAATPVVTMVPAYAATTPATGTTTTFDKYLVMKKNANVPNATFSYTVSIPTDDEMNSLPNPEDTNGTNLTVRKGIYGKNEKDENVLPTASDTVFKAGEQTFDAAQKSRTNTSSKTYDAKEDDQVDGLDATNTTKKYAKKTSIVDFSGVTFSEPGVYRYKITENDTSEKGITKDSMPRYLDVYVESADNGTLSIRGYVFHTLNAVQPKGTTAGSNNPEGKNKGFTNQYATSDITLSKNVTGNQGYRDRYFKFHVDITDLDANARMFVTDGSGSRTAYSTKDTVAYEYNKDTGTRKVGQNRFDAQTGSFTDVAATQGADADMSGLALTADGEGKASFDVYLKHGETVKLNGLTAGAKYTIKETSEDYTATATKAVTGTDGTTPITLTHAAEGHTDVTPQNVLSANDETVAFTNDREGVLPTGVIHNNRAALSIAGVAAAGACIAVAVRKQRKAKEKAQKEASLKA